MWLRYVMISNLLLYFISETLLYETNKKNIYVQLVSAWLMTYLQVVLVVLDVNQMSTEFISAEGNRFRSHLWLIWWYPSMLVAFVTHNLVATYPEDLSAPSVRPTQTKRYEKWFSSVLKLQKTKKKTNTISLHTSISLSWFCVSMQNAAHWPRNSVVTPSMSSKDWSSTSKLVGKTSLGSGERTQSVEYKLNINRKIWIDGSFS